MLVSLLNAAHLFNIACNVCNPGQFNKEIKICIRKIAGAD
jgi:hypothetical protein